MAVTVTDHDKVICKCDPCEHNTVHHSNSVIQSQNSSVYAHSSEIQVMDRDKAIADFKHALVDGCICIHDHRNVMVEIFLHFNICFGFIRSIGYP